MRAANLLRNFMHAPWPLLFATSACGLMLCALNSSHADIPSFCSTIRGLSNRASWPLVLDAFLIQRSPTMMLADWGLMLISMMPPLLAMPLVHIWRSSLPRRRLRAIVGFVVAYCAQWLIAGMALMLFALLLRVVFAEAAFGIALTLALLWSASPWHQIALNRGHRASRIGLFGWAADRDCLRFGVVHGAWCVAACWAWMLLPLVSGAWHYEVMLLAGVFMLVERLAPPGIPRWRWPAVLPAPLIRSVPLLARS